MTALPTYTSDFEKGLNSKTISNCFHDSFTCRPLEINVKTTLRFMRVKSRVTASKPVKAYIMSSQMQFQVGLSFPWSVSKWAPDTPYLNIISSATHDYLCTFMYLSHGCRGAQLFYRKLDDPRCFT